MLHTHDTPRYRRIMRNAEQYFANARPEIRIGKLDRQTA